MDLAYVYEQVQVIVFSPNDCSHTRSAPNGPASELDSNILKFRSKLFFENCTVLYTWLRCFHVSRSRGKNFVFKTFAISIGVVYNRVGARRADVLFSSLSSSSTAPEKCIFMPTRGLVRFPSSSRYICVSVCPEWPGVLLEIKRVVPTRPDANTSIYIIGS